MNLRQYDTAIGTIGIAGDDRHITNLYFDTDIMPGDALPTETPVMREAARQLAGYLAGELRQFDLPLDPRGTPFLNSVWKLLRGVPYGATASYKDIASAVGNPRAVRAVGMANNRNPIPIFIPCHRVVGSDGKLVGYRGGLALKEWLLEMERRDGNLPLRTG